MASKETPIPFTVGDQERLVKIEQTLERMPEAISIAVGNIKIVHTCAQEERIGSLEKSRENWYKNIRTGIVSVIASIFLAGLGFLAYLIGLNPTDGM